MVAYLRTALLFVVYSRRPREFFYLFGHHFNDIPGVISKHSIRIILNLSFPQLPQQILLVCSQHLALEFQLLQLRNQFPIVLLQLQNLLLPESQPIGVLEVSRGDFGWLTTVSDIAGRHHLWFVLEMVLRQR
jgi:hypothetical protein